MLDLEILGSLRGKTKAVRAFRLSRKFMDHDTQQTKSFPSKSILITFEGTNFPEKTSFYMASFPVDPCNPNTIICLKCHRFDHIVPNTAGLVLAANTAALQNLSLKQTLALISMVLQSVLIVAKTIFSHTKIAQNSYFNRNFVTSPQNTNFLLKKPNLSLERKRNRLR